jgi:hypothetical protein
MRRLATTTQAASLHQQPTAASPVTAQVAAGQTVTAIDQRDGWLELRAAAGTGWAPAGAATLHDVLIADLYPFDNGAPSWTEAETSPQLAGAILKASEGVAYGGTAWWASWFRDNWGPLRSSAGARYGDTWFRGAYHFFRFGDDPAAQARFFLATVDAAGGWDVGDLLPVVDVELGGDNAAAAAGLSGDEIVAQITAYVAAIRAAIGAPVMLYGGSAMRDKGITSRMSCAALWTAAYEGALPAKIYEEAGWTSDDTVLWQYTDGETNDTGFPTRIAGLGGDLSVFRPNDLEVLAARLTWKRGSSN